MRIAPGCCDTFGYSTAWSAPFIGTLSIRSFRHCFSFWNLEIFGHLLTLFSGCLGAFPLIQLGGFSLGLSS